MQRRALTGDCLEGAGMLEIRIRGGLGSIVAPAVIGAFAAVTGLVSLADLQAAVEDRIPVKAMENVAACTMAYLELASPTGLEAGLAGGSAR